MTTDHPDELLAEYVDGTLGPEARGRVEAHLAGCVRCRDEVAMAREGREALAALPELPAPAGLDLAVRRRRSPRRWRVLAPVAAAAVLVAGAIVVLGQLGGPEPAGIEGGGGGGAQAPAASAQSPGAAGSETSDRTALARAQLPRYSESNTDYRPSDLAALARGLRDDARESVEGGLAPTAAEYYRDFDPSALPARLGDIYRCVVSDVPPEQLIVPLTIEAASFEGEPAYLASFLQGPAPDQPYDRIVIWVVGRQDCTLRSLASQRL